MNLYQLWRSVMKWILAIFPPIMVLVFLVFPIVDAVSPWKVAETEFERLGRGGARFCVGMSSYRSSSGDEVISESQRSYLIVPERELVSLTEIRENGKREVELDSSKSGFWVISALFLLFAGVSIVFSIPKVVTTLKERRADCG